LPGCGRKRLNQFKEGGAAEAEDRAQPACDKTGGNPEVFFDE
jgi:hypothetical protein